MNIEFSRHILEKFSDVKFNENPSRGKRSCSMRTNGRADGCKTDRHDEVDIRFWQFSERS